MECVEILLADQRVCPSANVSALCLSVRGGYNECVTALLSNPGVDPAAQDNDAIRTAARLGRVKSVMLLLADPRVDPSAVQLDSCKPNVLDLVRNIQAFKDGDLEAFQRMDSTALSDFELEILIYRNRPFPEAYSQLLKVQLAHVAGTATIRDDPYYEMLINSARSRGLWWTAELRKVVTLFAHLVDDGNLFSGLAAIIAVNAYDPRA